MSFEIINDEIILRYFYYIFVGLIFAYLIMGRKGKDMTKRIPLFLIALIFFAVMIITIVTKNQNLPAFIPSFFFLLLFATSFTMFRERFFPYRFRCVKCDSKLTMKDIFLDEGYLCSDCKGETEENRTVIEDAAGEDDNSEE